MAWTSPASISRLPELEPDDLRTVAPGSAAARRVERCHQDFASVAEYGRVSEQVQQMLRLVEPDHDDAKELALVRPGRYGQQGRPVIAVVARRAKVSLRDSLLEIRFR